MSDNTLTKMDVWRQRSSACLKDPKQELKNMEDAFKVFDRDGNGYLSGSVLRDAMVVMGMDRKSIKVWNTKIKLKGFKISIAG